MAVMVSGTSRCSERVLDAVREAIRNQRAGLDAAQGIRTVTITLRLKPETGMIRAVSVQYENEIPVVDI